MLWRFMKLRTGKCIMEMMKMRNRKSVAFVSFVKVVPAFEFLIKNKTISPQMINIRIDSYTCIT